MFFFSVIGAIQIPRWWWWWWWLFAGQMPLLVTRPTVLEHWRDSPHKTHCLPFCCTGSPRLTWIEGRLFVFFFTTPVYTCWPTNPFNHPFNQSINKFITRHSTEARAIMSLSQTEKECLKSVLENVNRWSSPTAQWKRVPESWCRDRETTSSNPAVRKSFLLGTWPNLE